MKTLEDMKRAYLHYCNQKDQIDEILEDIHDSIKYYGITEYSYSLVIKDSVLYKAMKEIEKMGYTVEFEEIDFSSMCEIKNNQDVGFSVTISGWALVVGYVIER
jgi:hypothetical protein